MPTEDLYATLGVPREASADEIRAAYRAKARSLHPDVNKAPDAQEMFAKLQEAYEVLSDPEKRRRYDHFGSTASAGSWNADPFSRDVDLDDLGSMFDSFFTGRGGGASQGGPRHRARPRKGQDIRRSITVSLADVARASTIRTPSPNGGSVDIRIPMGCTDGTTLRVTGHGSPAQHADTPPGDLLLVVNVNETKPFTRGKPGSPDPNSLDITVDLPVTIAEATLGATIDIPTLTGTLRLTIPPGTGGGKALRLKDRGLESQTAPAGHLYALVRIVPPDPSGLSDDERDTLRAIADRQPNPRGAAPSEPEPAPPRDQP